MLTTFDDNDKMEGLTCEELRIILLSLLQVTRN